MALKALIFDCDGTLAETEEAHRTAFNMAFADAALDWHWSQDRYRDLLKVTGGRERIAHFVAQDGLPTPAIEKLHDAKNRHYTKLVVTGQVELRPGVTDLMEQAAAAGIALAIATTTSRSNLNSLITATALAQFKFAVCITGEDVTRKKPDPEAYLLAVSRLNIRPDECLAFEDSVNGIMSAKSAGIRTIATPGAYTSHEDFSEAGLVVADLSEVSIRILSSDLFR